jgi:hypothetical protein
VHARLALHACPREIEFIDELPKTRSRKVQRFFAQTAIASIVPSANIAHTISRGPAPHRCWTKVIASAVLISPARNDYQPAGEACNVIPRPRIRSQTWCVGSWRQPPTA